MRRQMLAVLVPAMTITGLAGLAEPATARVGSEVVVTRATGDTEHVTIRGKVTSPDGACEKRRKVWVYHDTDPAGPDANDYLIGSTKTKRSGKWSLTSVALPDKVYAVIKDKSDCSGDASATKTVAFHSMR